LGEGAPEVGEAEEEGGEDEDGTFAEVVCQGYPEEVEKAEDENGPKEEFGDDGLGFLEFDGEDVWKREGEVVSKGFLERLEGRCMRA